MIALQGPSYIMFHDENLQVIRESQIDYLEGKPIEISSQTFQVDANVQPLNARDLLLVPEGNRYKEQYYVFAQWIEGCMPKNAFKIETNDTIVRKGIYFQVQGTEYWGSFIRAHIMRDDTGPHANP